MRFNSKNWGVILLIIIAAVLLIFYLNRTVLSENMESGPIDLKDVNSNVSSFINDYLDKENVSGSFTLNSEKKTFEPITINFSVKNGVLKFNDRK